MRLHPDPVPGKVHPGSTTADFLLTPLPGEQSLFTIR